MQINFNGRPSMALHFSGEAKWKREKKPNEKTMQFVNEHFSFVTSDASINVLYLYTFISICKQNVLDVQFIYDVIIILWQMRCKNICV